MKPILIVENNTTPLITEGFGSGDKRICIRWYFH
jgi:hypothetical protein